MRVLQVRMASLKINNAKEVVRLEQINFTLVKAKAEYLKQPALSQTVMCGINVDKSKIQTSTKHTLAIT